MTQFFKNNFYTSSDTTVESNTIKAIIHINPNHEVFKGHFPQMPVVPGVCQVQIIKELLEDSCKTNTLMISGDNIKFTGMILPDKHPTVNVEITYKESEGIFSVDAKLYSNEIVFTKYKGKFKIVD